MQRSGVFAGGGPPSNQQQTWLSTDIVANQSEQALERKRQLRIAMLPFDKLVSLPTLLRKSIRHSSKPGLDSEDSLEIKLKCVLHRCVGNNWRDDMKTKCKYGVCIRVKNTVYIHDIYRNEYTVYI